MRPMAVLVSVLTLIATMAGIVWLGRGAGPQEVVRPPVPKVEDGKPQPSENGPHPVAVIPETTFDFGVMMHRTKGSHTFVVKNEGTVPLKLATGRTTCQCTIGKLGDETVPPGGETTIELNWEIKAKNPRFQHEATIHTDDPKNVTFQLIVKGLVGMDLIHMPEDLSFNSMSDIVPSTGTIYIASSNATEFKITKVESSSEYVTAKVSPLTAERKTEFVRTMIIKHPEFKDSEAKMDQLVKQAYEVEVIARGKKEQGPFNESITIHTDIPDTTPIQIPLRGDNPGAFQFFPQGGVRWAPKEMLCDLGEFDGATGKKASLNVFARGLEGQQFELTPGECDVPLLKVTATPDPAVKNACRLNLEFAPGTPTLIRTPDAPATVVIKSNHPRTESLTLKIIFSAK